MNKFTTREQQVIWQISINIVANYKSEVFTDNVDEELLDELYKIYADEYPVLTMSMYSVAIVQAIGLYEKQGFIEIGTAKKLKSVINQ